VAVRHQRCPDLGRPPGRREVAQKREAVVETKRKKEEAAPPPPLRIEPAIVEVEPAVVEVEKRAPRSARPRCSDMAEGPLPPLALLDEPPTTSSRRRPKPSNSPRA
jgi:hypothetical protein